jgi:hypothetical protein
MDKYITSEVLLFVFGLVGVVYVALGLAISIKKLFAKADRYEAITRGEYEKDEKHRAERIEQLVEKFTAHEERADLLIESITQLRVEVAKLTAQIRSPQGDCVCRTPSNLSPSSALLPRPSPATSPPSSGSRP